AWKGLISVLSTDTETVPPGIVVLRGDTEDHRETVDAIETDGSYHGHNLHLSPERPRVRRCSTTRCSPPPATPGSSSSVAARPWGWPRAAAADWSRQRCWRSPARRPTTGAAR